MPLIRAHTSAVLAEREPLLVVRLDNLLETLPRDLSTCASTAGEELVDGDPASVVELDAGLLELVPEHEAEEFAWSDQRVLGSFGFHSCLLRWMTKRSSGNTFSRFLRNRSERPMLRSSNLFLTVGATIWLGLCSPARAADPVAIGARVTELSFHDQRYERRTLADLESADVVVLVFLDASCAAVGDALPRLEVLSREFRERGAVIVGVNSNVREDVVDVGTHASENELSFPVVKDFDQSAKTRLGVSRTPVAVVLDRDRTLRYRGAISEAAGNGEGEASEPLRDAIRSVVEGKPVAQTSSPSAGCLIRRPRRTRGRGIEYHKHVAPILAKHCSSCHSSSGPAPFSLGSYEEVRARAEDIASVVATGRMPPVSHDGRLRVLSGRARLSRKEKELLRGWAAGGAVEGAKGASEDSARDGSQPTREVRALPHRVAVDTWISTIEILPSRSEAVRADALVLRTAGSPGRLAFVAPLPLGMDDYSFGDGAGLFLPAGSKLDVASSAAGRRIAWTELSDAPARRATWPRLTFRESRPGASIVSSVTSSDPFALSVIYPRLASSARDLVVSARAAASRSLRSALGGGLLGFRADRVSVQNPNHGPHPASARRFPASIGREIGSRERGFGLPVSEIVP